MGTTKLTRKEIIGEDPVHDAILSVAEWVRSSGKAISLGLVAVLLLGAGGYFGLQYLDRQEAEAQRMLAKGIDFYHAKIDPAALDDPYGKGNEPVFKNEEAKYEATTKEFSSVISTRGSSRLAVIARYYLGLCQIRQGQKDEAIRSLETVRDNTRDRSIAYLGKRALVKLYTEAENYKAVKDLLEGMIRDPQCDLPKAELKLQLARNFIRMGNREEAIKTLKAARDESGDTVFQSLLIQDLSRLEESPSAALENRGEAAARP